MKWNFILGKEDSDNWIMQSDCGKYLLIKDHSTHKDGVIKQIKVVALDAYVNKPA